MYTVFRQQTYQAIVTGTSALGMTSAMTEIPQVRSGPWPKPTQTSRPESCPSETSCALLFVMSVTVFRTPWQTVLNANINRSPSAYLNNPAEERARYLFDQDKDLTHLRFDDASGNARGFFSFPPSMEQVCTKQGLC